MQYQTRSHNQIYREFVQFIQAEAHSSQISVRKRMFSVFFWCFILPAILSVVGRVLIVKGVFPFSFKQYIDWLPLFFPVTYSLFYIGKEVIADLPKAFQRGGAASALEYAISESDWREKTTEKMTRQLKFSYEDWSWIYQTFEMDLNSLRYRAQFLTLLAGAVFFMILQGFDVFGGSSTRFAELTSSAQLVSWIDSTTDALWQLVGLVFFLAMLYLASSQTHHLLKRYLDCVRMILLQRKPDLTIKTVNQAS